MLEAATLSARHPGIRRRAVVLPISVLLHGVALGTALFTSVWGVEFPRRPPDQFSILPLLQTPRLAIPPEAPAPERPKAPSPTPRRQAPAPAETEPVREITAPIEITALGEIMTDARMREVFEGSPAPGDSAVTGTGGIGAGGGSSLGSDTGAPIRVGGDVRPPVVIHRIDPRYPTALVKLKIEGPVVIECVIDRDGQVRDARVLRTPHPALAAAATQAVRAWRFEPGTLNGRPIDVIFVLTVNFQIN